MALQLLAIQFNHHPLDKRQSALNIRLDADTPITRPEWRRDEQGQVHTAPAAYALNNVDEAQVTIRADFSWSGTPVRQVQVRAIQPDPSDQAWWLWLSPLLLPPVEGVNNFATWDDYAGYLAYRHYYEQWRRVFLTHSNVLGEIKPQWCAVERDGTTGTQALHLENVRLRSRGVGVHPIIWRWQYRLHPAQAWIDFATSQHQIYTTVGLPTLPWVQQPLSNANVGLPWAAVLEFSCRWAQGTFTADAAAQRITEQVFGLGNGILEYGCPIGAHEMYANTPLNFFDCTAFLERLQGGIGNGPYVNCTDCACIVSTFANALGADLWQSRMGEYVPAFLTREILAIGSSEWQTPCNWGLGFMFHEVAWKGNCTDIDNLFDACLAVDANLNPFLPIHVPVIPTNLRFGWPGDGNYRTLLARATDQLICRPRPAERRRRILI